MQLIRCKKERFMKKAKILTVLAVLLAMGVTACGSKSAASSGTPAGSSGGSQQSQQSQQSGGNQSQSGSGNQSQSGSGSQSGGGGQTVTVPDPDGHHFGADTDVAADATLGTVAYKKATCSDNDGFERLKVNQSVVTYDKGGRKSGTPEGYTKLSTDGDIMSFKFKADKKYMGKLYLYGCMDGWGSSSNHSAGFYYRNNPNVEIKVGDTAIDLSGSKSGSYAQWFGEDASADDSSLSQEGYAPVGNVVLEEGVNVITYKRVQTLNMLIKDFVFIVEEFSEWSPATPVAAKGEGYVGYNLYNSNLNDSKKIEINALDGTLSEGATIKEGTETGYVKLTAANDKISWKFDFAKAGVAMIYHLGFMDAYASNHDVRYSWTKTSGDHTPTAEGNFRFTVNGEKVDKSAYLNIRAEDLTKDGEAVFEESKNFSNLTLLPIGQAAIAAGDNTLEYERLGSYNYAFSKVVLVFFEHTHAAATTWEHNDDGHWHPCNDANCPLPDIKFDYAEHTWVADTTKTNHEATSCADENIAYEVCSVCGATREVRTPSTAAHVWEDKTAVQNSDSKNVIPMECSGCHHVGAKMSINDYSSVEFKMKSSDPTKMDNDADDDPDHLRPAQGKDVVYKIVVAKAGTYSLEMGMLCESNGGKKMSERGFKVKVNNVDATVDLDGEKTPDALGMTSTKAVIIQLCSAITLNQGENTIAIQCNGYRLHYTGNLAVYEK